MKRSFYLAFFFSLIIITVLSGCGGGTSSPGSPSDPTSPDPKDSTVKDAIIAGGAKYEYKDGIGTAAAFCNLKGIAIDGSGNIYVTDTNAIRKLILLDDGSYEVKTIAETYKTSGYYSDGIGFHAIFNSPYGLVVDSSGDVLYVADTDNHIIRKLTKI